jgi:hypothetical protein
MSRFLPVACLVAFLVTFIVGCGGGDGFDRVPVSGTVTCEDMENPSGSIMGSIAGTEAPYVSTPLTDGKFTVAADQGPIAGSYDLEIRLVAGEAAPAGEAPEGEVETGPEVLYRKTVDIPAGGSESLTIDLTSADKVDERAM